MGRHAFVEGFAGVPLGAVVRRVRLRGGRRADESQLQAVRLRVDGRVIHRSSDVKRNQAPARGAFFLLYALFYALNFSNNQNIDGIH